MMPVEIKDNEPWSNLSKKRATIDAPESEGGRELNERILPRDPRATGVTLPPLNNEARERDELIPGKQSAAGEALRATERRVSRPITVDGNIQETPNNETEEENK